MSQLNEKQAHALNIVLSGHSLLILGPAGTGKSFLLREIVETCTQKGMRVSLTCTTGIACAVYNKIQDNIKAQTIHQWSGIDDGRFSPSELKDVIKNNPKYAKTLENVRETDLLVIDECSMLSRKMFDSLSEVCAIKNEKILFGGIQLVLCGDFHQLAPVPNPLCQEDGEFCFRSQLFTTVIPHKITLTDVFRQSECELINAIQEVAVGEVSSESKKFMEKLNRPLSERDSSDGDSSIKLFATNDRVDDFNRDSILKFSGPVYEFISNDTGQKRYLSHILAPHILWLKIGAPVILLRNLSTKLVNGLSGKVFDIKDNIPVVEFPSVNLKVPVQRLKFSGHCDLYLELYGLHNGIGETLVYMSLSCNPVCRTENRDIAVREQLPLKLAFALTIHKSQGMTLDRVEVDCSGIFKPGQLGVAIGRARTSTGLRVINFSQRACMPHPESVENFLLLPSKEPLTDKSCCRIVQSLEENPYFFPVHEIIPCGINTDIDLNFEPEFDDDFDEIIKTIDRKESDIVLPEELNLDMLIDKLRVKDVLTPFQQNTNSVLDNLDRSKFKIFCQREYKQITSLTDKIKFQGPVKCQDLGEFYSAMHEYHTGTEFLLSCMMLFENESFTAEHKHICFNVSVELRKFILSKKAEVYSSTSMKLTERSVTNASRARIRYIGGYCIAKVSSKFVNKKETLRYATAVEKQQNYEEAVYITQLLNCLREDEQFVIRNSAEPESLLDVTRKQYVNRGLTNISDELFSFFIKLSDQCLNLLSDKNFHRFGDKLFEFCKQTTAENSELFEAFSKILDTHSVDNNELSEKQVCVDTQAVVRIIYKKIIKIYLLVLIGQFRKDILDSFKVTKKMAHRKQIQVSKSSAKTAKKNKGTEDAPPASRTQQQKRKRKNSIGSSSEEPSTSGATSSLPSSTQTSHSPLPGTSSNLPSQDTPQDEVSEKCKSCWTEDRDTEWIQCDNCSGWLHRTCAGLKHHMKWKKFQKKGAVFLCNECQ